MPDSKKLAPAVSNDHDPKVARAVVWLRQRKAQMEKELTLFAKQIGEYLLKEFFDDDVELAASQNPKKNVSFRRLCKRSDIPFSESSLRRFIQVAANFRLLPREHAKKLLPSHHSVLYQVADPDTRREVGIRAADDNVSVRDLRKMVKGKGRRKPGAGRKPDTEFAKNWRQLLSVLQTLDKEADKYDTLAMCGLNDPETDCNKIVLLMNRILNKMEDVPESDRPEQVEIEERKRK